MLSALLTAAMLFFQAAPAATPPAPSATPDKTVSPLTVTPAPSAAQSREADQTVVVCTSEIPLGSRFPVKTCATRRARAERTQEDQMEIRKWTALRPGVGN